MKIMHINQEFNKMIDSCGEKMTGDELSFLAGYAEGLVRGVAQSDSINYVAAKRFLKVFESAVEYGKKLQIEDTAEKLAKEIKKHNEEHKISITEYYSKHKVGNTTAMLIEAMTDIKNGCKVIYISDDNSEYISDKIGLIVPSVVDVSYEDIKDNFVGLYCERDKVIKSVNDIIYSHNWVDNVIVYIDCCSVDVQKIHTELTNKAVSHIIVVKSYSNYLNDSDILDTYDKDSVNVVYVLYDKYENTLCFNCLVNKDNYGNNLYLGEKEMKMLY